MEHGRGTGAKPTVLVVDDEPLVRMTTADMLRLGGFDVLEAAAGAQALDVLATGQPVVALVTDVRMPGMDGVDLSRRVRATHPDMPVVFVSGDTHLDTTQLPEGAQCLRKPVPLRELIATVFQAVDGHHSTHVNGAVQ
jgi:CheY-like chemotaxis protein